MFDVNSVLLVSSSIVLGVFLGAQIAEARLFVPIWKTMDPDDFFEQHESVAPLIYRFFAPLTIAATVLPLTTVFVNLTRPSGHPTLFWILGLSTVAFFSTYFLYFKEANQKFADRALSNAELPDELVRWGNWHWLRIGFESVAFTCSAIILLLR